MGAVTTATVETLTAEVRTLMVAGRQVTLSMYRQLDGTQPPYIEPWGRVGLDARQNGIRVVGARIGGPRPGELVRCELTYPDEPVITSHAWESWSHQIDRFERYQEYANRWGFLPKLVLAGLR